jgi:hypothetical protein
VGVLWVLVRVRRGEVEDVIRHSDAIAVLVSRGESWLIRNRNRRFAALLFASFVWASEIHCQLPLEDSLGLVLILWRALELRITKCFFSREDADVVAHASDR